MIQAELTATLGSLDMGHRIAGASVTGRDALGAVLDPGKGAVISHVRYGDAADVDEAVAAARHAFQKTWRQARPLHRARVLMAASVLLTQQADRFAVVECVNVGKPLREARNDVVTAARFLEYYAGVADKLEGESIPLGPDMAVWTEREPAGVTGHIVPWNAPLVMMVRGLAPALAAGCTAVVKPAEATPLTALMFADLMQAAGLPDGVVNVVIGAGAVVGAALARHPDVNHVTFTGSVATGKAVMAMAAGHLATVTLELGGKSPLVILADADIDAAIQGIMRGGFTNSGQICAASSRVIVASSVFETVTERLAAAVRVKRLGYGLDDPDIGPLISSGQRDRVEAAVVDARDAGCQILQGGDRARIGTGEGYFFEPTLVVARPDDDVAQNEIFGPVLCLLRADGLEEAIAISNNSRYGLMAGIYTKDLSSALRYARQVEAGQVFINKYLAGGVETPVGGVKDSGFGREKGLRGLDAYLRTKCITVAM